MGQAHIASALGVSLLIAAPAHVAAQRDGGSSVPRAGVPLPPRSDSRPLVGFGSLNDGRAMGRGGGGGQGRFDGRVPFSPYRPGFSSFFLGSTLIGTVRPEATVMIPYAVPQYYPVVVYRRVRAQPPAPEPPSDPAKSKTLVIGVGHDGGGGVMRIQPLGDSALRLTWRGSVRPIREARFFLADSLRMPIHAQSISQDSPSAVFSIADLESAVAYTGLTIIYATGATVTTLVPFEPEVGARSPPTAPRT